MTYRGTSDMDTPLNLTNHAYFNLHGNDDTDILDHTLTMNADKKLVLDDHNTVTGQCMGGAGCGADVWEGPDVELVYGRGWMLSLCMGGAGCGADVWEGPDVELMYGRGQMLN